jgi:hypothetical protein
MPMMAIDFSLGSSDPSLMKMESIFEKINGPHEQISHQKEKGDTATTEKIDELSHGF